MNPRGIRVVFGHITRLAVYDESDFRSVDRLVVHPEYERYKKNDLAILRLSERVQSSNHDVLPLLMRKTANVTYGDTCITLGWGQIYQVSQPMSVSAPWSNATLPSTAHIRMNWSTWT